MRITYVTHTRFPTEKAHGLQVASVCQALGRLGHAVTLVTPTIGNPITEDPLTYYGIPPSAFSVVKLPHFNALCSRWVPGKLAFLVAMRSFRRALSAFSPAHHADLFYTRSPRVLSPLLATGVPVVLELHALPRVARRAFLVQCRRCAIVVCLTRSMRDALLSWGLDAERVLVEGDAVDLERFRASSRREEAKARWLLPPDRPAIGYVGSLVTSEALEKGVRELLDAFALLRDRRRRVFGWIVGGPSALRENYVREARARGLTEDDVRLEGIIPFTAVADALSACDILVYPAPKSGHSYFLRDTSPLKLFEYMAAARPIVCADLPPLRDVVDASVARLCAPGDPQELADGIAWVLDHPGEAAAMAARAHARAQLHSWEERMQRIFAAIPAQTSRFAIASARRFPYDSSVSDPYSIAKDGTLYALIIPRGVSVDGAKFFTPPESPLQVGVMERPAGYIVQPHRHPLRDVRVQGTPEFLSIAEGRVRAIVYDEAWAVLGEAILGAGDALLLLAGGHSFEVLEPCRILEVKQGPYAGDASSKIFR